MTKKVLFYSLLSYGHLNVCGSIGSLLLNNHPDEFAVYFLVDPEWQRKLSKIDSRFRFGLIEYDNPAQETRLISLVQRIKGRLALPLVDRFAKAWTDFLEDPTLMQIDEKAGKQVNAMYSTGIPFAFVHSSNPLIFGFDGFPKIGSDAGVLECEKKKDYDGFFADLKMYSLRKTKENFEKRGIEMPKAAEVVSPLCETFQIYAYPDEIDYYDQKTKDEHGLWQMDTPLFRQKIPEPYELPAEFRNLPEKRIVYVSLGSVFSVYTDLLQRLVDALDKVPDCKFLVSNGDKLKLPSNRFVGQSWFDQLAVLQVCDAMVSHGGNNTLCECFYFGVPCLTLPAFADQINNAQRICETGFGYKLENTLGYSEEELADKLKRTLEDEELRLRWRNASKRIQSEDRIVHVVNRLADYVQNLGSQKTVN